MKFEETKKLEQNEEYQFLNLLEQMLESAYVSIGENINLEHIYQYELKGVNRWGFTDKRNIEHEIRLTYNPGLKDIELSVKFYWFDGDKPSYNKPPYTDEMVFNTYIKIFINEILYQLPSLFKNFHINKLTLDPIDYSRYRLYKLALNNILDKFKYDLVEDQENKLLYIVLK
jgi:hypothetical protein